MSDVETFDPGGAHAVLGVGTTMTRHAVALGSSTLCAWSGPAVGAVPVTPALVDDGPASALVLVARGWERRATRAADPDARTFVVLGAWHADHQDGMDAVRLLRSEPFRAPHSAWNGAELAYLCAEPGTLIAFAQRQADPVAPAYVLVRYVTDAESAVPVTSAQATAILDVLCSTDSVLQGQINATRDVLRMERPVRGDPVVDTLISHVRMPRLALTPRVTAAPAPAAEATASTARHGPELVE